MFRVPDETVRRFMGQWNLPKWGNQQVYPFEFYNEICNVGQASLLVM
jgi:hypothetical protein